MTSIFILTRITRKNYDFLKLDHFSYFLGDRDLHNLVPWLSLPNNYIGQSHKPYKSRFLVQTSYTIIYAVSFLNLL